MGGRRRRPWGAMLDLPGAQLTHAKGTCRPSCKGWVTGKRTCALASLSRSTSLAARLALRAAPLCFALRSPGGSASPEDYNAQEAPRRSSSPRFRAWLDGAATNGQPERRRRLQWRQSGAGTPDPPGTMPLSGSRRRRQSPGAVARGGEGLVSRRGLLQLLLARRDPAQLLARPPARPLAAGAGVSRGCPPCKQRGCPGAPPAAAATSRPPPALTSRPPPRSRNARPGAGWSRAARPSARPRGCPAAPEPRLSRPRAARSWEASGCPGGPGRRSAAPQKPSGPLANRDGVPPPPPAAPRHATPRHQHREALGAAPGEEGDPGGLTDDPAGSH